MARVFTQAELDELTARPGYRVREQFVSTPGPVAVTSDVNAKVVGASAVRPGVVVSHETEAQVQTAVLGALQVHPAVEWAYRFNVGGMYDKNGQYVRFGFKGCSDILGQMRDGRFLAVEVKRPGKKATDDQAAFLARVRHAYGVAFIATGVDDVMRELEA